MNWRACSAIIGVVLALKCLGTAYAQPAKLKEVRVPFVGCKSDGQVGLLEAPKEPAKAFSIDAHMAQRLAYYKAENGPGVLGPRGWYCFGTYGSSNSSLLLKSTPFDSPDVLSIIKEPLTGPAIQFAQSYGDTSGRFEAAQVAARVFPAQETFTSAVIAEGLVPADKFPRGPFAQDRLTYLNDYVVEYQTPPKTEGLGTKYTMLNANTSAVHGVAIMPKGDPDLFLLAVRLPPDMDALISVILQEAEQEHPGIPEQLQTGTNGK